MNRFATLIEKDPTKYPARMGKPWMEEEVVQLLGSIKKKKPMADIATEHERTVGGISAQLKRMAAEYYMNDGRTIEEIGKFTGLTIQQINDAIKKYSGSSPVVNNTTVVIEPKEPDEVVTILKDIRDKLDLIIKKMV